MSENNIIKKNDFDASDYGFDSGIILDGYNLAVVKKNNKFMLFDVNEKKLFVECIFSAVDIDKFSEGMLPIAKKKDGKIVWGYINIQDKTVINPRYKEVDSFTSGFAIVKSFRDTCIEELEEYNMGLINKKGYEIIASEYILCGNVNDDILVGYEPDVDYECSQVSSSPYFFDKNYHRWEVGVSYVDYVEKNKFIYTYTFNGRLCEKRVYTCYLHDDFLVVRCYKWDITYGKKVTYDIYGFNGCCLSKDEMLVQDYEKAKRLMKR